MNADLTPEELDRVLRTVADVVENGGVLVAVAAASGNTSTLYFVQPGTSAEAQTELLGRAAAAVSVQSDDAAAAYCIGAGVDLGGVAARTFRAGWFRRFTAVAEHVAREAWHAASTVMRVRKPADGGGDG